MRRAFASGEVAFNWAAGDVVLHGRGHARHAGGIDQDTAGVLGSDDPGQVGAFGVEAKQHEAFEIFLGRIVADRIHLA